MTLGGRMMTLLGCHRPVLRCFSSFAARSPLVIARESGRPSNHRRSDVRTARPPVTGSSACADDDTWGADDDTWGADDDSSGMSSPRAAPLLLRRRALPPVIARESGRPSNHRRGGGMTAAPPVTGSSACADDDTWGADDDTWGADDDTVGMSSPRGAPLPLRSPPASSHVIARATCPREGGERATQ